MGFSGSGRVAISLKSGTSTVGISHFRRAVIATLTISLPEPVSGEEGRRWCCHTSRGLSVAGIGAAIFWLRQHEFIAAPPPLLERAGITECLLWWVVMGLPLDTFASSYTLI